MPFFRSINYKFFINKFYLDVSNENEILASFLFLFALCSFSLPTYLDFGKIEKGGCRNTNETCWNLGLLAFNGAPELGALFVYLKRTYDIDIAIETGTFQGNTTSFFAHLFDQVHTIEIIPSSQQVVKEKFSLFPNVHCHLGNSDDVLKELLLIMDDKPILFYLDAHWGNYWPLNNELAAICKTHFDNCIIVIDDFQVPGRPDIPFDQYENHACSYPYIKNQLDQLFSEYTTHYIIPQDKRCRAKFLAIPSQMLTKSIP